MIIRKQMVSLARRLARTYVGKNRRRYVTVHETANPRAGAHAAAHANLQSRGNVRNASWHWSVDDKEAVQSFPHTAKCWHAGDGRGPGNKESIAIEICVNSDGDFHQALANAAALVRKIMIDEKIPISHVVQHRRWSGKTCPRNLLGGLKGVAWDQFIAMVDAADPETPAEPTPKPKPTPVKPDVNLPAQITEDGFAGSQSIGAWQSDFGTPVDRVVSSQSDYWKDRHPALTSGWQWVPPYEANGSRLIIAIQRWLGGDYTGLVDGLIGTLWVRGLQIKLRRMGYYTGRIDGVLGVKRSGKLVGPSLTIKAAQRAHNDGALRQK